MPRIDPLQPAFNSGELGPRLYARTDFSKYASALEVCQNLLPLPEGGVTRRPASRYVAANANASIKSRLLSFEANALQQHVIEIGEGWMRFYFRQGQLFVADTDAAITNPDFATGITDWDDVSTGAGSISHDATNERLTLTPGGTGATDIGAAEQDVATTFTGQEHVIQFQVVGAPGDKIEFQIGTATTLSDTFGPREYSVGYHCVAFTPTTTTFYVQFRNKGSNANKDVQIDTVFIIDDDPVEIDTPYIEEDLYGIAGAQSADVQYMFQGDVAPHKLERRGLSSWSLVQVEWIDGPYLDMNTTPTTLNPATASGLAVVVTASATAGINDGQGFLASDLYRLIRIDNGAEWGYGIIVGIASTTSITVHVKKDFAAATATADWRLGAWSDTTGWPKTGGFFEQRLYAAATDNQPQTLWGSQTGDFENHKPDDDTGTVEDDDALDFTLSADQISEIYWLSAGENVLAIGTSGGEWVPAAQGIVLTPNDITVRRQTTHGCAQVQPLRVGPISLFVQRSRRRVREFGFNFETDGYIAPDMTRLAFHITEGGIVEMAYQQEPDSTVWAVRNDGVLLSMTYRRDEDVVGWARHVVGGSYNGGDAVVESVTTINGAADAGQVENSEDRNEVWIQVKRTIDGQTVRYIEVLEGEYRDSDPQAEAYYSDSIITYDGVPTQIITGLDHLEGETVKIWADGAIFPEDAVCVNGCISLPVAVSKAQVGLGYLHRFKTLRLEGGNPAGTAVGKKKRIYGITFVFQNTQLFYYGPDFESLTGIDFREVSDPMDTGVPLYSGEFYKEFASDWDEDVRVCIEGDDPAPFTLLAMAPWVDVQPTK